MLIIFLFTSATRGWHSQDPARSCKEIRDLGASKGDGEYWIDPAKSGKPLKIYCDMTTDGGETLTTPGMLLHRIVHVPGYLFPL